VEDSMAEYDMDNWSGGELTDQGLYFSEAKPQGTLDDLPFDGNKWELLQLARSKQSTPESIANARNYLVHIGYLDREDSNMGLDARVLGAIKRFELHFNDQTMDLKRVLVDAWNKEDNPLEERIEVGAEKKISRW
jgi:hypothetical protein